MKLHVGCGTVYLDGYVNVDLPTSGAELAKDNPSLAAERAVPESDYYRNSPAMGIKEFAEGFVPETGKAICDVYGSFDMLPFEDGTVDEILSRQVFEHLSGFEAQRSLMECRRVLKPNGLLRLDVPDHPATLEMWRKAIQEEDETTEQFCERHVFGSKKNEAYYHLCGWDQVRLIAATHNYGFGFVEQEPNIHPYPAFCIRFEKVEAEHLDTRRSVTPWRAAWEYCGEPRGTPLTVPSEWKCIEIGCGRNPWPRADLWTDKDPKFLKRLPEGKWKAVDIMNLPSFERKWDFAFVSHVLEHVQDPLRVAGEINRIAKRGCIVCPSPFKEGLWSFYEDDHQWWVLPPGESGALRFIRVNNDWRMAMKNRDFESIMHQMLRYGNHAFGEHGRTIREAWHRMEPEYDVIHRWDGELRVEVLE